MAPEKRSPCPVACTLDLIGDKWTLLIIRDMFFGRAYFKDFGKSPERIATNILSDRLAKLVEWGLVEKYTPTDAKGRDAYRLTKRGKSLRPVLRAIAKWGLNEIEGTSAAIPPLESSSPRAPTPRPNAERSSQRIASSRLAR